MLKNKFNPYREKPKINEGFSGNLQKKIIGKNPARNQG